MFAKPQEEHRILEQLVGEWIMDSECVMGPDQPVEKSQAKVSTRSLEGMWIVSEMCGECPQNGKTLMLMTLGYDPTTGKFPGTFVGSMMPHMWVYSGTLSDDKRRIVLDTTGPKFDGTGMTQYQDIVEFVDQDKWILRSQMLGDDGKWVPFMTATNTRVK